MSDKIRRYFRHITGSHIINCNTLLEYYNILQYSFCHIVTPLVRIVQGYLFGCKKNQCSLMKVAKSNKLYIAPNLTKNNKLFPQLNMLGHGHVPNGLKKNPNFILKVAGIYLKNKPVISVINLYSPFYSVFNSKLNRELSVYTVLVLSKLKN